MKKEPSITLLQINVEVNFGSTGKISEDIGNLAIDKGWNSIIAYGRKKRESKSRLIKVGTKWDHFYHLIQTRLFDRHGLASKRATRRFIAQIKAIKPSIIHLHNLHGYYLNFQLLFKYLADSGIPVIWTLHDCWALTGHCTHFENVGCLKWASQCNKCPQIQMYPASLGWDRSKKNHTQKKVAFTSLENLTIVTVSQWLNSVVKKSFLSKYPSKTISNGINTTTFQPKSYQQLFEKYKIENQFVILGVASVWSENKGIKDFINLSKSLKNNEQIVLIGLNEQQIKNLPGHIIGIKRTENVDELARWYSLAGVYVNTSVEESFGLTTAEAMACGTPAIVYQSTASPEMINDKVGIVIKKNDIVALRNAISNIKSMGRDYFLNTCRNHALEHYDKDKNFVNYIELYGQLIRE